MYDRQWQCVKIVQTLGSIQHPTQGLEVRVDLGENLSHLRTDLLGDGSLLRYQQHDVSMRS
jgi:hypothetical protein